MPPRYPPIAPRGPNAPSTPETQTPRIEHFDNLDARPSDADAYSQQLAALRADRRRFLTAHHPIRDALHMALQQPAGVLLARYAATLRAFQDAQSAALPSDDPDERNAGTAADVDDRPAIVAYTETMVAKALLGDLSAAALVSDRIEGKPGLRKADLDAETAAQRERVRNVIGVLVEQMVERRAANGETARVIDGEASADE